MLRKFRLRRGQRGFTLIELLIVVAIIGIIAALLIPNFLESLQKAKQKRTMGDMKNIGTAMMAWLTDEVGAASAGATVDIGSWDELNGTTHAIATSVLVPRYVQELPVRDGWKNPFTYGLNTDNPMALRVMAIHSGGRDGTGGGTWAPTLGYDQSGPYDPSSYDNDLLWADGYFVIWPEKP
jgi:type II secretion system protein G